MTEHPAHRSEIRLEPPTSHSLRGLSVIGLDYEMSYTETIEGPLAPTTGAPLGERLCWQVVSASLTGDRIDATLAMPGIDWIRLGPDGIRRQDLRAQLVTRDGAVILLHYDTGLIRPSQTFLDALSAGAETSWADQYMRMVPEFDVGDESYAWLTQSLFVAEGRLAGAKQIEYRIYRVL